MRSEPSDSAWVYAGAERAGILTRHAEGCTFSYEESYRQGAGRERGSLGASLPIEEKTHLYRGANVHPYFAGLLPEGWRLGLVTQNLKASPDDFFSLLLAVGKDAIGDISVCRPGQQPEDLTPDLLLREEELDFDEVQDRIRERFQRKDAIAAIPGVQKKVSAAMISLPVRMREKKRALAWILKLTPTDYPQLVENEAFFMQCAKECGLQVAPTRLLRDRYGRSGLLVQRFDRVPAVDALRSPMRRIPQEDLCQVLGRFPADKYHVDCREVLEGLSHCDAAQVQRLYALRLWTFSYLIANGDLHAKNFSIYKPRPNLGWLLTPAYDLLSTLPYGDARMALRLEGHGAKLTRHHFLAQASRFGIPAPAIERVIDALLRRLAPCLGRLETIGLEERKTQHLHRVIETRMKALVSAD